MGSGGCWSGSCAKLGKVLIISKGRRFCFPVSHLSLVSVVFSMVSFLLQSKMKSLDSVIQLLANDTSA